MDLSVWTHPVYCLTLAAAGAALLLTAGRMPRMVAGAAQVPVGPAESRALAWLVRLLGALFILLGLVTLTQF